MKKLNRLLTVFTALLFSPLGMAQADPCDFTGSDAFTWQQVMDCYRSVPFNHDDLENTLQVIQELRPFSDLDELYEERYGWRANLAALNDLTTLSDYPDDFSMHNALRLEHKKMRNPHIRYVAPFCYTAMLTGYLPFDFGSTTRFTQAEQQIVFIEDTPILPELYEQFTGIDPTEYIGMKVVSINGTPTLDYFREFGRTGVQFDDSDSANFNRILNGLDYSLRSSTSHNFAPERAEDVMVLESRNGEQVEVAFPWIFARRSLFGMFQIPPTASTAEFIAACTQSNDLPFPTSQTGLDLAGHDWRSLVNEDEIDPERTAFINRKISGPKVTDKDFFEVPPGRYGKDIQEIIPLTGPAKVLQYGDDTTVLRLFNTQNWVDVARQGVEHACQNSDNLIIDLRRNGGGTDVVIQWLYSHLFPEVNNFVEAGKLPLRFRNDNTALNDVLGAAAVFDANFVGDCSAFGASCWLDIDTEDLIPITDFDWFLDPSFSEQRASSTLSLTRQVGLTSNISPTFDAASCAGKFNRDNLYILTDATNCSGGYFLVSPFKDNGKAQVVTMGGLVGEEIPMGICRGGATIGLGTWPLIENIVEFFGIPVPSDLPSFNRDIESNMETLGAYRIDRTRLHFNDPIGYDTRINVWSDSPDTDGYVYQKVLTAGRKK